MKFRITMKELAEWGDRKLLRVLVTERRSELNPYTPLATRLSSLEDKLNDDSGQRLVQFQCQKEGTLFYYQSGMKRQPFVQYCPVCKSSRTEPTGREYVGVNETYPLAQAEAA